jgi:6-methylsalicylate decarboxylase
MDAAGVRKAIVSVTTPGVWFGDSKEAIGLARDCNDYASDMRRQYPERFGFFAALPLPDTQTSIEETARSLDQLGASGIGLMTNYDGRYLGDPAFAPLFAELDRRGAIVFVHPMAADCCRNLIPGLPSAYLELPFDTTRTIASLLYSGAFASYPRIRFIFSHGGGTIPMLADRLAIWAALNADLARRVAPQGVVEQLAKQYYDTVGVTNSRSFAALRNFTSIEHLLFGTDYPYLDVKQQRVAFDAAPLSRADQKKILSENFRQIAH